ncbi:MAG: hypothetical protein E3J69_05375 [Anaerolineales bacterium]|nr:MAG: hypothetical protein E3J69_05375 [Anaerolineales bacterium]
MKKLAVIILVLIVALLMAACARSEEMIEVTFDGKECTITGQTELLTGEQLFVYKNLSNMELDLWAGRFLDGHTAQEYFDLQSEPGEYYEKPSWVVEPRQEGTGGDASDGGEVFILHMDDEGEYILALGSYGPLSLWNCLPQLLVIEAPSE